MKPTSKTSSSILVSSGFEHHHIDDLRRELSIIQQIIEKIPYTEGNEFTFALGDFLGKHFQGLGIIEFRDKVLSMIYRFERLGMHEKVWVGKSGGLHTLLSFRPIIQKVKDYQKSLNEEIARREDSQRNVLEKPVIFGRYTVDTIRKQAVWNGLTKKWLSTYHNDSPEALKLCEYIFAKHLNPPRHEKVEVNSKLAFRHSVGDEKPFELKKLHNLYGYLVNKLAKMFKDQLPDPKKVIRWEKKKIFVSVSS